MSDLLNRPGAGLALLIMGLLAALVFAETPARGRAGLLFAIAPSPQTPRPEAHPVKAVRATDLMQPESAPPTPARARTGPPTASALRHAFGRIGYRLDAVRSGQAGVPHVLLQQMPRDLDAVPRVQVKKNLFFRIALPLVLHVNAEIRDRRDRLLVLAGRLDNGGELAVRHREWLAGLADHYGLKEVDLAALKRRVDIVPPSLALAQSAEESGWGGSRFARQGNALFGQRTWGDDAPGIVPRDTAADAGFKVRAFGALVESVRIYIHNLNTHAAYSGLRQRRAALRAADRPVTGSALVAALAKYSEKGQGYIDNLRALIRVNDLTALDNARLREREAVDTARRDAAPS